MTDTNEDMIQHTDEDLIAVVQQSSRAMTKLNENLVVQRRLYMFGQVMGIGGATITGLCLWASVELNVLFILGALYIGYHTLGMARTVNAIRHSIRQSKFFIHVLKQAMGEAENLLRHDSKTI